MLLANTSDSAVSARPKFFPASGEQGNPIELPEIILGPRQIADVDLRPLTEAATRRTDLSSVSVQVLNSGAAGSLIGALYSRDKVKRLRYDVPLRDSGPIRSSTGSYPWRVDDDYTTIVNITNISDHPASFLVDIRYPTGHYFVSAKDMAAGGTATFDLRKLISEQKPDNQGNVIPLSTTGGQFHWSIFGSPPSSKFIGRSEVVSASNHVASSYSCPTCCPESGPFGSIIPPDDPVPVGGFATVHTAGTVTDCNGNSTNIGSFEMDDFWVDDPAILSYSPDSGASTVVEGLAAGETVLNGSWWSDQWTSDGWSMCFESRGEETASQPMAVFAPTKLVRIDYTTQNPGAPDGYGPLVLAADTNNEVRDVKNVALLTNRCGPYRNLVYELEDQKGEPVTIAYSITENFSNYTSTNTALTTPGSDTKNISANGLVNDTMFLGKTLPNCLGSNDHESFDQSFVVTINGTPYSLSTVNHISRGRFSGTYKVDVTITTP